MSFEIIANNIVTYFETFINSKKIEVRYDNDPRETPFSGLWCKLKVEFEDSINKHIGRTNSYRNKGNVIIEIYNSINIGLAPILNLIDPLVIYFTEITVNYIKFFTPEVKNNGRVNDNYMMTVICPFYVDN